MSVEEPPGPAEPANPAQTAADPGGAVPPAPSAPWPLSAPSRPPGSQRVVRQQNTGAGAPSATVLLFLRELRGRVWFRHGGTNTGAPTQRDGFCLIGTIVSEHTAQFKGKKESMTLNIFYLTLSSISFPSLKKQKENVKGFHTLSLPRASLEHLKVSASSSR